MKYVAQNFSLNMVNTDEDYDLKVTHLTMTQFLDEIHDGECTVRLSDMAICQELGVFPNKGNIAADIHDEIYTAQFFHGVLKLRKVSIKPNTEDIQC